MMNTIHPIIVAGKVPPKLLPGLEGVEAYVNPDEFIYLVRELYKIVFKSKKLGENKYQLQRRISKFERQSNLPGFFSTVPLDHLLSQLDDAQYIYPIKSYEITLPTFH